MNYSQRKKLLILKKREAMKREFNSSKERKSCRDGFNAAIRSLKRSEKQAVKKQIEEDMA
jgi:hypothetical protein